MAKNGRRVKENVGERQMRRRRRANNELPEESEKRILKTMMRRNATTLLECSTAWAFRWFHGAFYCAYCDIKFVDTQPLREHVISNHLKEPPSQRVFSKLRENNMVKIDIAQLQCRLCDVSLGGISYLKTHLESHGRYVQDNYSDGVLPFKLDDGGFFCQLCTSHFLTFPKINEHMNTHYQNYVCDTCGKGFVSKSRFRAHVHLGYNNYVTEKGSFSCRICDETFSSKAARTSHRSRVHNKGIRYNCPRCSEVFTTYKARSNHLVNFHAQQSMEYFCNMCDKSFNTSSKRSAHCRVVHSSPSKLESHQCYYCTAHFATKSKLVRHMKSHRT